jgi:hypothetical protein
MIGRHIQKLSPLFNKGCRNLIGLFSIVISRASRDESRIERRTDHEGDVLCSRCRKYLIESILFGPGPVGCFSALLAPYVSIQDTLVARALKNSQLTCGETYAYFADRTLDPEDLARVHYVVRVDSLLDCAHHAYCLAMLGEQEVDLAAADAVLTGAGAAERQCAMHQSVVEPFRLLHLFRVVRIEHEADVKIAVTGMANDR